MSPKSQERSYELAEIYRNRLEMNTTNEMEDSMSYPVDYKAPDDASGIPVKKLELIEEGEKPKVGKIAGYEKGQRWRLFKELRSISWKILYGRDNVLTHAVNCQRIANELLTTTLPSKETMKEIVDAKPFEPFGVPGLTDTTKMNATQGTGFADIKAHKVSRFDMLNTAPVAPINFGIEKEFGDDINSPIEDTEDEKIVPDSNYHRPTSGVKSKTLKTKQDVFKPKAIKEPAPKKKINKAGGE